MEDNHHAMQDFVAGWCGGVTGLLVGHPFDTVKARLQTDGLDGKTLYRGTRHCFAHMIKNEGVRSLYKGMAAPLVGMAAINAIVFGVYGNIMKKLERTAINSLFAGAVAGGVQCVICCPMELIKLRMQVQKDPMDLIPLRHHEYKLYNDPYDAIRKIAKKDGWLGLNKGMTVTLWREIPAFSVYFYCNDVLTRTVASYQGVSIHDISGYVLALAGGISGIAAWLVSYPFDVVKSRIQVDGMNGELRYKGMVDCFVKSYQENREWRVFFKGLNSTLLRAFPVNAVTFPTVALILRYMRREE